MQQAQTFSPILPCQHLVLLAGMPPRAQQYLLHAPTSFVTIYLHQYMTTVRVDHLRMPAANCTTTPQSIKNVVQSFPAECGKSLLPCHAPSTSLFAVVALF